MKKGMLMMVLVLALMLGGCENGRTENLETTESTTTEPSADVTSVSTTTTEETATPTPTPVPTKEPTTTTKVATPTPKPMPVPTKAPVQTTEKKPDPTPIPTPVPTEPPVTEAPVTEPPPTAAPPPPDDNKGYGSKNLYDSLLAYAQGLDAGVASDYWVDDGTHYCTFSFSGRGSVNIKYGVDSAKGPWGTARVTYTSGDLKSGGCGEEWQCKDAISEAFKE